MCTTQTQAGKLLDAFAGLGHTNTGLGHTNTGQLRAKPSLGHTNTGQLRAKPTRSGLAATITFLIPQNL